MVDGESFFVLSVVEDAHSTVGAVGPAVFFNWWLIVVSFLLLDHLHSLTLNPVHNTVLMETMVARGEKYTLGLYEDVHADAAVVVKQPPWVDVFHYSG